MTINEASFFYILDSVALALKVYFQGTSRPAHYMLLHDDNNLSGHTLQVMSFFLCHTYARCTRTVAMPAKGLNLNLF